MAVELEADTNSPAQIVRRAQHRLTRAIGIANAAGAWVAFQSVGFLIPVFLDPDERWRTGLINAPLLLAALLAK